MKDKIDGYCDFEVIRNYKKINDKIIVIHLDGSVLECQLQKEKDILALMEEQGLEFAGGISKKNKYLLKVGSASSGLIILLFGTLQGMEMLATNELMLGTCLGSILLAVDIIGLRKLFFYVASSVPVLENQEKYNFYFENKNILGSYVSINELDNYSLEYLKKLVSYEKKSNSKAKQLKRKR